MQALGSPNGVNLLRNNVHVRVLGIASQLVHLLVGKVFREVPVDNSVDEVNLQRSNSVWIRVIVINNVAETVESIIPSAIIGQAHLRRLVFDDVQTVFEGEGSRLRIATVEVAALLAVVPRNDLQLSRAAFWHFASNGISARSEADTRHAGHLVVVFTIDIPFCSQRLNAEQAREFCHAVFLVVRTVIKFQSEALHERIRNGFDLVKGHVLLQRSEEVVGEDVEGR